MAAALILTPAAIATPAGNQYTEPDPPSIDRDQINLNEQAGGGGGDSGDQGSGAPATTAAPSSSSTLPSEAPASGEDGKRGGSKEKDKGSAADRDKSRERDRGEEEPLAVSVAGEQPPESQSQTLGSGGDDVISRPVLVILLLSLILAVGVRLLTSRRSGESQ